MLFAMHIPDGMLHPAVAGAALVVSAAAIAHAVRRLRHEVGERLVPLVAVTAAGIFAAQMVNFPIFGAPVSGHFTGGVLAAVVLGPWGGALAIAAVLIVQCLLFGDGGILALGANVLNMAVIGGMGGYAVYRLLARWLPGPRGTVMAAMLAAWLMVPAAALACSLELAAGGQVPFRSVATLMLMYHGVIGLGEALITGLVVAWLAQMAPELIQRRGSLEPVGPTTGVIVAVGLSVSLALAIFGAPLASEWSDGLESVAEQLGFADRAVAAEYAPFPDYALRSTKVETPPWLQSAALITALLGSLGTLITWGCAWSIAKSVQLATSVCPDDAAGAMSSG